MTHRVDGKFYIVDEYAEGTNLAHMEICRAIVIDGGQSITTRGAEIVAAHESNGRSVWEALVTPETEATWAEFLASHPTHRSVTG